LRILALDTAMECCSVALLADGRLAARERMLERGHAESILPMLDELLRAERVRLGELAAIAFGRGPGSFTGVRLAASVTQGLAYGAGLKVVPVSNLRAVAQRLFNSEPQARHVLVCNDARMREVYWGCFERSPAGYAQPVGAERVTSPEQVSLAAGWDPGAGGPRPRLAGTAFAAYAPLRSAFAALLADRSDSLYSRAEEIAQLAVPELAAGRVFGPEAALPVYLRDDVARPPLPPGSH
jgi:tRNA threonylcarbamoyladenosine biosynthesis protein TsaB